MWIWSQTCSVAQQVLLVDSLSGMNQASLSTCGATPRNLDQPKMRDVPIGRNTDLEARPCTGSSHCHESTDLGEQGVWLAMADDDDADADNKQSAA